jgi:hypothetical protein
MGAAQLLKYVRITQLTSIPVLQSRLFFKMQMYEILTITKTHFDFDKKQLQE